MGKIVRNSLIIFAVSAILFYFLASYSIVFCPDGPPHESYYFDQKELTQFSSISEFNISKVDFIAHTKARMGALAKCQK
ncbi:MAG: hypothetical protein KAK00_08570 [Nanoarchaeota archaeon]|nr:hypothetical protein [Thermodesulfovibrionia bacterium]MCK5283433.1 hypothetical protein [Nanoarchaeota archaeon]